MPPGKCRDACDIHTLYQNRLRLPIAIACLVVCILPRFGGCDPFFSVVCILPRFGGCDPFFSRPFLFRCLKGNWVVKRKTAPSRFTRAVTKIAQWCRIHRHHPIAEQHQTLSQKLRGHFAYYGITGNSIALARFRQAVLRVWWEWLGRRRGGNRPTWAKFLQFEQRWALPPPIAVHSVCRVRSKGVT